MNENGIGWAILGAMRELSPSREEWFARDLCDTLGVRSGTIYPTLARLERTGKITSRSLPGAEPRRRMYRLVV